MATPVERAEAILLLKSLHENKSPVTLTCHGSSPQTIILGGYVTTISDALLGVERAGELCLIFDITTAEFSFLDPREAPEPVRASSQAKYDSA
jgi:hypothetical protein